MIRSFFVLLCCLALTAIAALAQPCSESQLSESQVSIVSVNSGFFTGQNRLTLSCGPLLAEAFYNPATATIALMLEDSTSAKTPPVPASTAARLYRLLLVRLLKGSAYQLTIRNYIELGDRMAIAAGESKAWDRRRGRPRQGYPSAFVKQLLNTNHLFPEFSSLAGEFGYRLQVKDVEAVRLCDGLPCGAQVTFQMQRQ